MDLDGGARRAWLRVAVGPNPRIKEQAAANGARLLATLTLVHLAATMVGTVAATLFWRRTLGHSLLWGSVGGVLVTCTALVVAAYAIVRAGHYRTASAVYVSTTALFPPLALLAGYPDLDVGILAASVFAIILAATLLSDRWATIVTLASVAAGAAALERLQVPSATERTAFPILLAQLTACGLLVVLRRHHARVETSRLAQVKASETAVQASEERLRALLGASQDLIVVLDAQGARQAAFGAVEEVTGYDPGARGALSHFEAMHPDDRERVQREFIELLKQPGQVVRTEWRHLHKDGEYRWYEGLVTNRLGQAVAGGIVVNIRDVSGRKLAEQAIAQSEHRYRTLFRTITDGIFVADKERRILEVNEAACQQHGYTREELLELRLDDLLPPEHLAKLEAMGPELKQRGHVFFESEHRRKDGSVFPLEVAASLVIFDGAPTFMAVARDITWRRNAEAEHRHLQNQLQHAVKMESIGRLAGGVAHDFNNLLTAILGHVDFAARTARQGGDVQESLAGIRDASRSASMLTRQLLAFSRKHVGEPRLLDMNGLVQRLRPMLERLLGEDIELRTVAAVNLGAVHVDPGLIEQAVINLSVNARDAMPDGGVLLIETADVELDEAYVRSHPLASRGRHVRLAVSDTGVGMSDEAKEHLFEPFFTTKPRGQGTGLGLAITYGAVRQGGGSIEVYSEPGKGTTFKIYLPVAIGRAIEAITPSPDEGGPATGGSETILVVEDDERVRLIAAEALRQQGYELLVAANGEDALALAIARHEPIHLLLTDVVMPIMNGSQLSRAVAKIHPETRTLFTSGYTENIIAAHGVLEDGIEFLGKPYSVDSLVRRVRRLLDR